MQTPVEHDTQETPPWKVDDPSLKQPEHLEECLPELTLAQLKDDCLGTDESISESVGDELYPRFVGYPKMVMTYLLSVEDAKQREELAPDIAFSIEGIDSDDDAFASTIQILRDGPDFQEAEALLSKMEGEHLQAVENRWSSQSLEESSRGKRMKAFCC